MSATAFRTAIEAMDVDAAVALMADDVVFESPVVFKPYVGREAVATLLHAVAQTFEDFSYVDQLEGADGSHVGVLDARGGPADRRHRLPAFQRGGKDHTAHGDGAPAVGSARARRGDGGASAGGAATGLTGRWA